MYRVGAMKSINNLQHLSSEKVVKATRTHSRKHPVPPKLGELIELVNLLPAYGTVDEECMFAWAGRILAGAEQTASSDKEIVQYVRQTIDDLPSELRDYIGPFPFDDDPRLNEMVDLDRLRLQVLDRYDYVIQGREALSWLIGGHHPSGLRFSQLVPRLEYNAKRKMEMTPSPLLECILTVEEGRIRRCPICMKIYWADRKDQPACPKSCSHALRSRRYRKNYLEKYKHQRDQRTQKKSSQQKKGKHGS